MNSVNTQDLGLHPAPLPTCSCCVFAPRGWANPPGHAGPGPAVSIPLGGGRTEGPPRDGGAMAALTGLPDDYLTVRSNLHLVATHVLARARFRATGRFGLRVTWDGLGTPAFGPNA